MSDGLLWHRIPFKSPIIHHEYITNPNFILI